MSGEVLACSPVWHEVQTRNVQWPRPSVCLSLVAFPHYCTDLDVTWGMAGVPPSCALLGRYAIGARVSLLRQHSGEHENSASASTHSCAWFYVLISFDKQPHTAQINKKLLQVLHIICYCISWLRKNKAAVITARR